MQQLDATATRQPASRAAQPLYSAAIIDAEGREIPITEQMIQQACRELEQNLATQSRPA